MDAVVKALVAIACVCIIAVSGAYGFAAYQRHADEQARVERVRVEMLKVAAEEAAQRKEKALARAKERQSKRKAFLERVEARKAARNRVD